jgi:hypothetical protein
MSVLVYSTGGKFEILPASAQAILGEYREDGENHGRKIYRRLAAAGQPTVLIFYWDARDGKDLCGWWFGDQIGAGQVWARASETSLTPPMKGWKCPVDGPPNKHIVCVPKMRTKEGGSQMLDPASLSSSKRAADTVPPAASSKRASRNEVFVLASSLGDKATRAVHKLVGEYVECGENHGRQAFKKSDGSGSDVYLYFWDQRDGWDCAGWWLGNSIGGAQVYARSTHQGTKPPLKGWKIPHDAAIRSDVTLSAKGAPEDLDMPDSKRLDDVKQVLANLETKSTKALEAAKPILEARGDVLEEGVAAVYDLLRGLTDSLVDAKASLDRHAKAAAKQDASEDCQAELTLQEERLDALLACVEAEVSKAKEKVQMAELGNAEEKDSQTLQKALEVALEVVVQAEAAAENATTRRDVVDAQHHVQAALQTVSKTLNVSHRYAPEAWKVVQTDFAALRDRCTSVDKSLASLEKSLARGAAGAAQFSTIPTIEAAAASLPTVSAAVEQAEEAADAAVDTANQHKDQLKSALTAPGHGSKRVIEEMQTGADKAQESIVIARGLTDGLARAAKQLPAVEQQALLDDIAVLRKRTAAAQKKLNPHKKARHEYHQNIKAKRDTDTFDAQVAAVEAELEQVAATFSGSPSEQEIQEAEEALPGILVSLSSMMKAVEEKVMSATAASATVFLAILDRARIAKEKVEEMKIQSRDSRKQLKAQVILGEAEAEAQKAEDWYERMLRAEEPWANNVEVVPEDVATPALDECTKIAARAEPEVQASKVKVMEKLVDVRQLPEGPLRFEIAEALVKIQDRVEEIALSITQLKIDTYARKTKLLMPEVIVAVAMAEGKVQKIVEAAAPLEEDNLEKEGKIGDMKESCQKVLELEKPAAKECESARAVVDSKKNDPKFGISPSFRTQLLKLEGRLGAAQKQLATLTEAAENAKRSKATFEEQKMELKTLTALVDQIELAALPLGDERPSDKANSSTAELMESTRLRLGQWKSTAESLATKHAHGSLRHAMKRLVAQAVKLQATWIEARATAGSRLDQACCTWFLREGRHQVKKAEDAMVKAGQAEGPFLQGVEVLSSEQAAKTIARCEAAAASAKNVIDEVCDFFKTRCKEASAYTEVSCKDDVASLVDFSKQASSLKAKLNQFIKDTDHRKSMHMNV